MADDRGVLRLLLQRDTEYRDVLAAQAQRVLTGRVAVERARGRSSGASP